MPIIINSKARLKVNFKTALKLADVLAKESGCSRMCIAHKSGLSLCTVNRVIGYLIDNGVLSENYARLNGEAKTCGHVYFNKRRIFTVVNLSSAKFSVWRLNEQLGLLRYFEYSYNQSISSYDNVEYFLRRAKFELWNNNEEINSENYIIIGSMNDLLKSHSLSHRDILIDFVSYAEKVLKEVFSAEFVSLVSVAKTLEYSDFSGFVPNYELMRTNYIYLGDEPFICCTEKGRHLFISPISENIGGMRNRFSYSMYGAKLTDFLSGLIGSVESWITPDKTIIDSDVYVINSEVAEIVKKNLILKFHRASDIVIYPFKPPLYVRGAGLLLKREVILNALTESDSCHCENVN